VPRLLIYRGDTLDREVDLGERNARIGRGDQNDIILPDPAKSVSRFHAELRFEEGQYSIVDLNSQNGTWVAGRRVPRATLEPGVAVMMGSYRLVLKVEPAPPVPILDTVEATVLVSPPAPAPPKIQGPKTLPLPGPLSAPEPLLAPAPEPKPAPIVEAPKPAPRPEPPLVAKVPPPKPAPKPEPPVGKMPPPKPAPKAPGAGRPPTTARPGARGIPKWLSIGGLAAVVLVVVGAVVFLTPVKSLLSGTTGSQPAGQAAPAQPPVAAPPAGEPVKLPEAQAPVPAAQPATEPPPSIPVPPPQEAKPVAPPTPAATPASRPAATPTIPRERAAAPGGRRGAAAVEVKPKPANLAQSFEDARSAMNRGDYLAAIAGFESVLKADPKYPDAADLLGVARGGAKNASLLAVESGNKSEASGDYAGAAKQYERAQQLDPESTAPQEALRRMRARMQTEGEDAFKRARQYDALGRAQDAVSMYEKAIQLLPPDHASTKTAKERLAALKGGL